MTALHGMNHPVCGGCYIEKVSARFPPAPLLEQTVRCCACSRPVSVLIYWRTPAMRLFVPYCPDLEAPEREREIRSP